MINMKGFAERAKANADPSPRIIEVGAPIGSWVRQGDIAIHRVADNHKRGLPTKNKQLAIGDSRGARHILHGSSKIFSGSTLPTATTDRRTPIGPLFVVTDTAEIDHPIHANIIIKQPGTYQITYQMNGHTWGRSQD